MSQSQSTGDPYIKVRRFPLKEELDQPGHLSIKDVYPTNYLTLVQGLAEVFQQLSQTAPHAFRGTSLHWIKKQIINSNQPRLAVMKAAKGGQSIWRDWTNVLVKEQKYTFITRTVWVAIENIYFSYRNLIIHDAALQMVTGYLSDETVVSDVQLERFFREEAPPRDLAQDLFKKLCPDLCQRFPGWQGVPLKWHFYINLLRQVRNMACEFLDDNQLYSAVEQVTGHENRAKYIEEFLKSWEQNKKQLAWEDYAVFLLMLKVKRPLPKLFPQIWNEYIKGKEKLEPLNPPTRLSGLSPFIFTFTVDYFHKKKVKTYNQLSAQEAWREVKKTLTKRAERARQAFGKAFPQETKNWIHKLADQGINACIESLRQDSGTIESDPSRDPPFPNKRKAFRAVHRATPLKSFNLKPNGVMKSEDLRPCLEDFIRARAQRKAEELIRTDMVTKVLPQLRNILATSNKFTNKRPVFKRPGFSLALADQQMFNIDLATKQLTLALVTVGKKRQTHTFTVHDPDDRLLPFLSPADQGDKPQQPTWDALNPTFVEKNGKMEVHIPFKKTTVPAIPAIKLNEPVEELNIGNDLGLHTFNYLAVIRTVSVYRLTQTSQLTREILDRDDLAHYSLNDLEALHKAFDQQTGTFNNLRQNPNGAYVRQKRNGNRIKQAGRTTWGKGHLRALFAKIRTTQAQLNTIKKQHPKTYQDQPQYNQLADKLSALWEEYGEVQQAIVNGVAAKTKDIVLYWHNKYPALPVRVQVEDLRWGRHPPKTQAGYYLAHNQKNFFHSQIQQQLAHLLRQYGIGVWRVRAAYTSQTCNYCGHYAKGQRQGRTFCCTNKKHRTPKGKPYTCNADLNAGRNVALAPPLSLIPIIS